MAKEKMVKIVSPIKNKFDKELNELEQAEKKAKAKKKKKKGNA